MPPSRKKTVTVSTPQAEKWQILIKKAARTSIARTPAVSATTQKPPFSDAAPAVDFATKGLATTTVKKATTAATPSLAAAATAPKPTLPNAAPAVYSDSKKPALKLDMSSRAMELMELLRDDPPSPTQEEVEAWSLRTLGVYRKPD
jgi:hypothetical protein